MQRRTATTKSRGIRVGRDSESASVRDYKSALKDAAQEATKQRLTEIFGELAAEVGRIPEGIPAQMTLLIDARLVHAVRRIKEIEGTSQQEFVRAAITEAVARRLGTPAPKPRARKRA